MGRKSMEDSEKMASKTWRVPQHQIDAIKKTAEQQEISESEVVRDAFEKAVVEPLKEKDENN